MGAIAGLAPTLLGTGAAGGLGTFGTILQVGLGVLGAVQQAGAGDAQAAAIRAQSESQARQAELQAKGEQTQAEIDAAERARRLRVTLAEQNAAFSASGFLPTSGSFAAIGQETQELGEAEIAQAQSISRINQQLLQQQAAGYRASGEAGAAAAKQAGRTAAFGAITDVAASIGGRGSIPTAGSTVPIPGRKPAFGTIGGTLIRTS